MGPNVLARIPVDFIGKLGVGVELTVQRLSPKKDREKDKHACGHIPASGLHFTKQQPRSAQQLISNQV